jgi:uncharacterized protein YjbI with pentapeptide repeats
MRLLRILLALSLLIALPGARAHQAARPASLDDSCSVSSDPRWTPQEKFVWERVCVGAVADFNEGPRYGGNLDPREPAGWPKSRVLRPDFLQMILFKDPYRRALQRHGVQIVGARFTDFVDLENAVLEHPLVLRESLLEKGVSLKRARSKFLIDFSSSKVAVMFDMYGLQLEADLGMQNGEFADVNLHEAHVSTLSLLRSKVTPTLDMNGFKADRGLYMAGTKFANVDLIGANVGGQLSLNGSQVTGTLNMDSLRVEEALLMEKVPAGNAEFTAVNLSYAHVGSQLGLRGSKVTGTLQMNGLQVGRNLLMINAEFEKVELTGAHVNSLDLGRSKVTGMLEMSGLQADRGLFMVKAEFDDVNLIGAHVGGELQLDGSKVTGQLDLSKTEIGGALYLDSAQWSRDVSLILHDAKVGSIPALADAWAPKLDLDGLTYRGVDATDKYEDWFGRFDHYAPQPYDQLALVVQSQGDSALATQIRYSGRERQRSEAGDGTWVWLTALKLVIGYGYYPYYAMYWVIGLVLAGAGVLRLSGEGRRNGMPYGLAYSFDMLLPIIQLRKRHSDIDVQGWSRYYFYGQKIMGWVLGSFLIAGLAGLTK